MLAPGRHVLCGGLVNSVMQLMRDSSFPSSTVEPKLRAGGILSGAGRGAPNDRAGGAVGRRAFLEVEAGNT